MNSSAPDSALLVERDRQFLDILEHCPAGLNVVDEEGRLLFHNARVREFSAMIGTSFIFLTRENSGATSISASGSSASSVRAAAKFKKKFIGKPSPVH